MKFVCGTDFGENATRATEIAARLAAKAGRHVVLVHALELPSVAYLAGEPIFMPVRDPSPAKKGLEKEADRVLGGEADRLSKLSGAKVVPRLSIGPPVPAILETAADISADLIVTGTHGYSAPTRWLLGSTADRLARQASDPVLVVREPAAGLEEWSKGEKTLKVLVGVAFDDSFDYAAIAAKALASWGPCDLHFAYAHSPGMTMYGGSAFPLTPLTPADMQTATVRAVTRAAKGRGLAVKPDRVHLLTGSAAIALTDEAKRGAFDLIVVGTHSRRGLERAILGSVAVGVLHHAPCPVLIAPVI